MGEPGGKDRLTGDGRSHADNAPPDLAQVRAADLPPFAGVEAIGSLLLEGVMPPERVDFQRVCLGGAAGVPLARPTELHLQALFGEKPLLLGDEPWEIEHGLAVFVSDLAHRRFLPPESLPETCTEYTIVGHSAEDGIGRAGASDRDWMPNWALEKWMPDPEQPGGDGALLGAIARLNANVEKLVQLLGGRQQGPSGLHAAIERIDARTSGIAGAITALQERSDHTAAEIEGLVSEQARLARWMTQVEQRVEDRDQPQGLIRHALERMSDLGERVSALEGRGASSASPGPANSRKSAIGLRRRRRPWAGFGGRGGPPIAVRRADRRAR